MNPAGAGVPGGVCYSTLPGSRSLTRVLSMPTSHLVIRARPILYMETNLTGFPHVLHVFLTRGSAHIIPQLSQRWKSEEPRATQLACLRRDSNVLLPIPGLAILVPLLEFFISNTILWDTSSYGTVTLLLGQNNHNFHITQNFLSLDLNVNDDDDLRV